MLSYIKCLEVQFKQMSSNDQWNQLAKSVVSMCHSLLFVFDSAFNFVVKERLMPKPVLKEWATIRSTFCLSIRVKKKKNTRTIFCFYSNWHLIQHCIASCLVDVKDSGLSCTFTVLEHPFLKNLAVTLSDDEPSLPQTTLLT